MEEYEIMSNDQRNEIIKNQKTQTKLAAFNTFQQHRTNSKLNDLNKHTQEMNQNLINVDQRLMGVQADIEEQTREIKKMQQDTSKIAANTKKIAEDTGHIAENTGDLLIIEKQNLVLKLKDDERKERQDRDRLEEKGQKQYMDLMKDLAFEFKKEMKDILKKDDLIYQLIAFNSLEEEMRINNVSDRNVKEISDKEFIHGLYEEISDNKGEIINKFTDDDEKDKETLENILSDDEEEIISGLENEIVEIEKSKKDYLKEKLEIEKSKEEFESKDENKKFPIINEKYNKINELNNDEFLEFSTQCLGSIKHNYFANLGLGLSKRIPWISPIIFIVTSLIAWRQLEIIHGTANYSEWQMGLLEVYEILKNDDNFTRSAFTYGFMILSLFSFINTLRSNKKISKTRKDTHEFTDDDRKKFKEIFEKSLVYENFKKYLKEIKDFKKKIDNSNKNISETDTKIEKIKNKINSLKETIGKEIEIASKLIEKRPLLENFLKNRKKI